MKKHLLIGFFVGLCVFFVGLGIMTFLNQSHQEYSIGGEFKAMSPKGEVALSDFHEKITMIFFGFTYCPDICPTTLSTMNKAIKRLPEEKRDQVQVLFMTLDPKRDTLDKLKEYTGFFNPQFLGLRIADELKLNAVLKQYAVTYKSFVPEGKSAEEYTLDHSTQSYLIGKDGKIREVIHHGSSPQHIAKLLERYL